jgi:hypothetical protein
MRRTIATLAALFVTMAASGQGAFYGPFTDAEAQLLSAVWPEIREAENYEDINWPAHGLSRAPGSRDVQRMMSLNWRELRQAPRFEQVNWDEVAAGGGGLQGRSRRYEDRTDSLEQQAQGPFSDVGPFTRDEAAVMSELWPEIRDAASFDDIDWRAYGLARAPGNADARRLLAAHWNEARREARFEDIDWNRVVDERELRTSRERQYAGGFSGGTTANPFTREESEIMSQIWGRIREAGNFEDIDWRSVGLSGPPGNREARRLMAMHWGEIREAARFEDISWSATTGPRRVLR